MKLRFIYSKKYQSISFDKCFCPCNPYLCQGREHIHLSRKSPVLCPSHSPPPHQNNHRSAFCHHFPHSRASHKYNYPVHTLFPQLRLISMFLRFIHISPKLHFTSHISPSAKIIASLQYAINHHLMLSSQECYAC